MRSVGKNKMNIYSRDKINGIILIYLPGGNLNKFLNSYKISLVTKSVITILKECISYFTVAINMKLETKDDNPKRKIHFEKMV